MALQADKLVEAVAEARRFLDAADKLRKHGLPFGVGAGPSGLHYEGGHLTAGVKRASMDLTRALAELRRA